MPDHCIGLAVLAPVYLRDLFCPIFSSLGRRSLWQGVLNTDHCPFCLHGNSTESRLLSGRFLLRNGTPLAVRLFSSVHSDYFMLL